MSFAFQNRYFRLVFEQQTQSFLLFFYSLIVKDYDVRSSKKNHKYYSENLSVQIMIKLDLFPLDIGILFQNFLMSCMHILSDIFFFSKSTLWNFSFCLRCSIHLFDK